MQIKKAKMQSAKQFSTMRNNIQHRVQMERMLPAGANLEAFHNGQEKIRDKIPCAYSRLQNQSVFCLSRPVKVTEPIAFLFPGHGSEYANMLYELRLKKPVVRAVFDEADMAYEKVAGEKLTKRLYHIEQRGSTKATQMIGVPDVMQPAIFTAEMALLHLLKSMGLRAEYHIGHSLGELAAWA